MKYNGTVVLTGMISPTDTTDTYATHEDILGKGGYHTVTEYADMLNISPQRQKTGMLCYVASEDKIYKFKNNNWTALSFGGSDGSGAVISSWDYTKNPNNYEDLFLSASVAMQLAGGCGLIDNTTPVDDGTGDTGDTTEGEVVITPPEDDGSGGTPDEEIGLEV